ncbi:secernin-2-like isoform X2 [Varroa jacobsoni]|uniref:Secernin-2 n=1 Tax=Varroa destructor TaxID=109461 RepID=A0A7M7KPT0_VARDE|nr:secernin-3-like isoform X2 [Varroa destructor]XP_022687159.1 secernin-2-like isoform X2 [Varroa jacobsoni]
MASGQLTSCDTFVVLAPAAAKNRVVFGKNSDRPSGEVQEIQYFPAATHPIGSTLKCTFIEVDQAENTYGVVVSRPIWMWGAEMGANEHGVVIGNEAVWTKTNPEGMKTKKLLGMDLVRLGLERSKSAKEAVDVITSLLEKYGQGGPCNQSKDLFYHNSFLIADNKEAYVLETADVFWAAEKISSGFRNISNSLTIGTSFDLSSEGLKEKAQTAGFWDGNGEFDFSKVFSDGDVCSRYEAGKKLLETHASEGDFDHTKMMSILRSPAVCMPRGRSHVTESAQVSVLSGSGHSCHWFTGTADPSQSVFKPFIFTEGVLNSKHIIADGDSTTLYKFHQKAKHTNELQTLLRDLEQRCIAEIDQILDCGAKPEELRELFKDACETEYKFYK